MFLETADPGVNPWEARDSYLYMDRAAVQRAAWQRRNGLGREPDANERDKMGRELAFPPLAGDPYLGDSAEGFTTEFGIILAVMSDIIVRQISHLTLIVCSIDRNIVCSRAWIYTQFNKETLSISQNLAMRSHMARVEMAPASALGRPTNF